MMQTNRKTYISISEKTYTSNDVHPAMRRENKIIIHDGWQWHIGNIHNQQQLQEVLDFLEIELTTIDHQVNYEKTGNIVFYNLSKNINSPCNGGFYSMEHLQEISKGQKLKHFKGLSNGSIVDCYIGIGDDVINIYRPNPNYQDVYKKMDLSEELTYRRNNWYL